MDNNSQHIRKYNFKMGNDLNRKYFIEEIKKNSNTKFTYDV